MKKGGVRAIRFMLHPGTLLAWAVGLASVSFAQTGYRHYSQGGILGGLILAGACVIAAAIRAGPTIDRDR